jgi:hypothetical protein
VHEHSGIQPIHRSLSPTLPCFSQYS